MWIDKKLCLWDFYILHYEDCFCACYPHQLSCYHLTNQILETVQTPIHAHLLTEFDSSLSFDSALMPPLGLFHRWRSIGPERVMTRPSVRAHQLSGARSMQSDHNPRTSLCLRRKCHDINMVHVILLQLQLL